MNVLKRSPRVDINISVNPQFELRLVSLSAQDSTAANLNGNRLESGHARFAIFSEGGGITIGALLAVEYAGGGCVIRATALVRPESSCGWTYAASCDRPFQR